MSAADDNYVRHKARPSILAAVRNLHSAHLYPYAVGERPRERSGTAVVVGAGPSLTQSLAFVAEMQREGALVLTVNAALPALAAGGVVPDVVVCREVVDVSAQLSHPVRCVVLDLCAGSETWRSELFYGIYSLCATDVMWFVPGAMQCFELAANLEVEPLFAGSAALTAAVALAEAWGAAEIVLVGVDLAFAQDGKGYADGSAWSGYRGELAADGRMSLEGAGFEAMGARSSSVGIPGPPQQQTVRRVPAIGGGEVSQLMTWADQQGWLENFAARHWDIDCTNATLSGASIGGWSEGWPGAGEAESLDHVVAMGLPAGVTVPRERTEAAIADVLRQCDTVRNVAASVLDDDGAPHTVPGYLAGCDVVEAAAAGALMGVHDSGLPMREGVSATYAAFVEAADAVSAVASGA